MIKIIIKVKIIFLQFNLRVFLIEQVHDDILFI